MWRTTGILFQKLGICTACNPKQDIYLHKHHPDLLNFKTLVITGNNFNHTSTGTVNIEIHVGPVLCPFASQFTLLNLHRHVRCNSLVGCALEHCWECVKWTAHKAGRHCPHCTCLSHQVPAIQFRTDIYSSMFIYLYVFFVLLNEAHKSTYPRTTPVKTAKGSMYWREITYNAGLKKGEYIATASGTVCTICDNAKKIKESANSGTLSPTLPTVFVRYVIHSGVGVKRHTGQGESTAHAAPNVFCIFQKQLHCNRQSIPTPNKVDVFGTGIMLPGCADLNQAGTRPCQPQVYAVLRSSGIKLYD